MSRLKNANLVISPALLLGWLGWLVISWIVNLLLDPLRPVEGLGRDIAIPPVRGMLESMIVGLVLIWPAWRLSQRNSTQPGLQTLSDLLALLVIAQLPLWAMSAFIIDWPTAQALRIDAILLVFTTAAALCIWTGCTLNCGASRFAMTVVCALLLTGGWLAMAATGDPTWTRLSPMYWLWALADPRTPIDPRSVDVELTTFAAAITVVWLLLLPALARYRAHRDTAPAYDAPPHPE